MSHGGGGGGVSADPNLTPLLDLVLQLLMFFIMLVNFTTEQVSGDIQLPYSDSAKPIEKADLTAIYLNQKSMRSKAFQEKLTAEELTKFRNHDSVVLIPGQEEPKTLEETKSWLRKQHEDALKIPRLVGENGEVKTVIHFRPDDDIALAELFRLMEHCKSAGYTRLKLRAKIRGGGGA